MNRSQWGRGPLGVTVAAALSMAASGLLALAVMACSGGGSNTPSNAPAAALPMATPTAAAPAVEINQVNLEFVPAEVTVKVGDVVLIKNSETAIHNAVIDGKDVTGNMMKDTAVPWTAPAPGEYTVTCTYHPLMKATIIVTK